MAMKLHIRSFLSKQILQSTRTTTTSSRIPRRRFQTTSIVNNNNIINIVMSSATNNNNNSQPPKKARTEWPRSETVRFDPTSVGLPEGWKLTSFSKLKG